jgi:hypothetical protein
MHRAKAAEQQRKIHEISGDGQIAVYRWNLFLFCILLLENNIFYS